MRLLLYNATFKPYLEYGITVWGNNLPQYLIKRLNSIQNRAIRAIAQSKTFRCHTTNLYYENKILKVKDLYELNCLKMAFKAKCKVLPDPIQNFFQLHLPKRSTRSEDKITFKNIILGNHPVDYSINLWNKLHKEEQQTEDMKWFIDSIKQKILTDYSNSICMLKNCIACR